MKEHIRIIRHSVFLIILFFKDFIHLLLERGEGREKGRRRNIEVQEIHQSFASTTPQTEDLACNPGMCPDWESNQWTFGSQVSTQSTEPHQPGLLYNSCHLPPIPFYRQNLICLLLNYLHSNPNLYSIAISQASHSFPTIMSFPWFKDAKEAFDKYRYVHSARLWIRGVDSRAVGKLYLSAQAAITKYHGLGGLNHRN